MAKKNKFDKRLQVRLTAEEREGLGRLAEENGRSVSDQLRALIAEALERSEKQPVVAPQKELQVETPQIRRGRYRRRGSTKGEVIDNLLGRSILYKTPADNEPLETFLDRAKQLARLEHSNIVGIYDAGKLEDGSYFYTMPKLPERRLATLLEEDFSKRDFSSEHATSLLWYVQILQDVCMALEYAYEDQGDVVHGALRPECIYLGDSGLTWVDFHDSVLQALQRKAGAQQDLAVSVYSAPEQLKGAYTPTHQSDLYALGVIFYQILAGKTPFKETNNILLLAQDIVNKVPLPPSRRKGCRPNIPEQLEQICLKLLEKQPEKRYESATQLQAALATFLQESFIIARKEQEAEECFKQAQKEQKKLYELLDEATQQSQELLRWNQQPQEGPEAKELYDVEYERRQQAQLEAKKEVTAQALQTIQLFLQAHRNAPKEQHALYAIAEVYKRQFLWADATHLEEKAYYRDSIKIYNETLYDELMHAKGTLLVDTQGIDATMNIWRYDSPDEGKTLVPVQESSSIQIEAKEHEESLRVGSYLLECTPSSKRYATVKYHVQVELETTTSVLIPFPPREEGLEPFTFVPRGPFAFGGDARAMNPLPLHPKMDVDDFWISTYPITFRDYLAYLDALHDEDPRLAEERIPNADGKEYAFWDKARKAYAPNYEVLWQDTHICNKYPKHEEHEWRLPVLGVAWFEAIRYCQWRSRQEGRVVLLPTEAQWEKAARGGDGRIFPWGNQFDKRYCKMHLSRPWSPEPEPVDCEDLGFAKDTSVYGMKAVVGTISEWVLETYTPHAAAANVLASNYLNLEQDPEVDQLQRGGGWIGANDISMRVCTRLSRPKGRRTYAVGFRIVLYPQLPWPSK